jgi:hypothetical protein
MMGDHILTSTMRYLQATYTKTAPNMILSRGEENRPFNVAPNRDPINVPAHKGRRREIWTKPWENFRVELTKALRLKQANDDPMAILMGAFKVKEKAGTRTAPVPIPKSPGKIPAMPPIDTLPSIDP